MGNKRGRVGQLEIFTSWGTGVGGYHDGRIVPACLEHTYVGSPYSRGPVEDERNKSGSEFMPRLEHLPRICATLVHAKIK